MKRRRRLLLRHDGDFLNRGFSSLAGVDEAGRGPLAGPVVASAVIVRDFSFSCRIDDSKSLTPGERGEAHEEILKKSYVGIGVVDAAVIDEINIFRASMLAMQEAVKRLAAVPACVLVDGPHAPELSLERFAIVDGDALSFSIACASIVAKTTRDRIMRHYHWLYPSYGFDRHKGYPTPEHFEALKKNGPCRIHRRSFKPVSRLCPSQ